MKVRYTGKPGCTGDASSFNMGGLGEVIVYYPEGDASSEEIRELEVYLEQSQRWVPMRQAFRDHDLVSDNRDTCFFEPPTPADRERGYTLA